MQKFYMNLFDCGRCKPFICQIRGTKNKISDELLEYMHGRRNNERRDSVTDEILTERKNHLDRISTSYYSSDGLLRFLTTSGFGSRKKKSFKSLVSESQDGAALHLTSSSSDWPLFQHILPEIAFAGHSNSGKSTLVNIMAGFSAKKGPASVSDRAGWTDQICFYQVGKRPPVLIFSDLPGYGHAVASAEDMKSWKNMTRDYLGNRIVLSRCCVLVDCTRGLCSQDHFLLKFLTKMEVPWQIILTKCDLLNEEQLANSLICIEKDLLECYNIGTKMLWGQDIEEIRELNTDASVGKCMSYRLVLPISSNTGAGIGNLWLDLLQCVQKSAIEYPDNEDDIATTSGSASGKRESSSAYTKLGFDLSEIFPHYKPDLVVHKDTRVREHLNAGLMRTSAYSAATAATVKSIKLRTKREKSKSQI